MADKIKSFFQKKVRDNKFKGAGKGHKLNEPSSSSKPKANVTQAPKRQELGSEARAAGQAALARLEEAKSSVPKLPVSKAAIQARAKRELEREKLKLEEEIKSEVELCSVLKEPVEKHLLAVTGVYYRCGLISDEVLDRETWYERLEEFFGSQLTEDEAGLSACLIINSCNSGKERIKQCIEVLTKYLDNIRNNPDEVKYRKIRMSNKVFQEKVKPLRGTAEFLRAAGFLLKRMTHQDVEEDFLVWDPERCCIDDMTQLLDALHSSESVPLELDRNLQVLHPSQAAERSELPSDFFELTGQDLVKEQAERAKAVDVSQTLMTQAMREKMSLREIRKYKFTLIRIRFPDSNILQGTFSVREKLADVYDFVKENLHESAQSFQLKTATREILGEEDLDKTLENLNLVPAVVLTFQCALDSNAVSQYLKAETSSLLQPL